MNSDWQKAIVANVTRQTNDFITLVIKPDNLSEFKSGNFIEVGVENDGTYKCYSVVSAPSESSETLEIGIKIIKDGELSPKLFLLKKNDQILMRGPMGAHFVWEKSSRTTVLIGGGSGICPMISVLRQYQKEQGKLKLLFSTKINAVYYKDELEKLVKQKGVEFTLIQTGKDKRINEKFLLEKFGKEINNNSEFFVAGPSNFVQDIWAWLSDAGVKPENLKTDDFGS